VFLVEDEVMIRMMVADMLEELGYSVPPRPAKSVRRSGSPSRPNSTSHPRRHVTEVITPVAE